jgi:hypothetical protein
MKSPVLQLDNYCLTRLEVNYRPLDDGGASKADSVKMDLDYDVLNHLDDTNQRMLRFRTEFEEFDAEDRPTGYHIRCTILGQFHFTETTPKGKEEYIIRVNGVNILYGLLRGILGTTTGQFQSGRFLPPSFMPAELVADVEKCKDEKRKASRPRTERKLKVRKKVTRSRPT